jgi:undecaprenyl-diphosphatase
MRAKALFRRIDGYELRFCELCNRSCRKSLVRGLFAGVSRLGDGVFWYVLILLLPVVYGAGAIATSLHMGLVGVAGLAIYKYLKSHLVRQRPYVAGGSIVLGTAPLDVYSFPSGHTLHAVSFTWVAVSHFPNLAWLLVPFATLVAMSRVILGLHYPSDVLAGAVLGVVLAEGSFLLLT